MPLLITHSTPHDPTAPSISLPGSKKVSRSFRSLSEASAGSLLCPTLLAFLGTTLIIYLLIPLLPCDSANMLHESARLVPRFPLLLLQGPSLPLKLPLSFFQSPAQIFFSEDKSPLLRQFNTSVCTFLLLWQPPITSSPPSTRRSRLTCATMRGDTTTSHTRCTPYTGESLPFLFSKTRKPKN